LVLAVRLFLLGKRLFELAVDLNCRVLTRCDSKLRRDRKQTAHLQTALLHLPVRAQIRTAQSGSIRSTGLGVIAATQG
jgi:hypothetical protein